MRRFTGSPKYLMVLAAAGVLGVTGGMADAAAPAATGPIAGCVTQGVGVVRVIDPARGEHCLWFETPLSWDRGGSPGQPGPAGPAGPAGETGRTGAKGPRGTLMPNLGDPCSDGTKSGTISMSWDASGHISTVCAFPPTTLEITPASQQFPTTAPPFKVKNTGGAPTTITSVTTVADASTHFSLDDHCSGQTLSPGASCEVGVVVQQPVTSTFGTILVVDSDAAPKVTAEIVVVPPH